MTRFGVVGASGVLVNLALLAVFVEWFHWHYALASVVAIEASILTNFALNSRFTWKGGDRGLHTFLNFQLVSLVGMAIQWLVLTIGVGVLHRHYMLAALAGIGIATIWNFGANHWFTFKEKSVESVRRHRIGWMYIAAAVLQIAAAAFLIHSWDGFVFTRTVENFVADGESPYATVELAPSYIYENDQVPASSRWYAYPPLPFLLQSLTYGPYFLAGAKNLILGRLVLKAPLVLAGLLLPPLAKRFALDSGTSPENAHRLEKALLFSPLLLFIGAAWGQLEVLLGLLVVGSFYALSRGRRDLSAVLFGVACLVKIFPLFLYPILVAYMWGHFGARAAIRHIVIAAVVGAAVCLPFYLPHPKGFIELVLLMHYSRPAGGFSLWTMPEWVFEARMGPYARENFSPFVSVVTLSAFALFLVSQSMRAFRSDASVAQMWKRFAIAFLVFLALSKVVHEQYLGLAVLMLLVASYIGPAEDARLRLGTRIFAIAATIAAFVRGFQPIKMVPADEARILFGRSAPELLDSFRQSLNLTTGALEFATQAVGGVLLVLAAIRFGPMWDRVRESMGDVNAWLHKIPHPVPHWTSRKAYMAAIGAAIILIPSAAVGILFPGAPESEPQVPAPLGAQVVGAYYETWWRNPSNDPFQRFGNWLYATTTPIEGFYSSRTGLFADAIDEMQDAVIDFALLPVYNRDLGPLRAFGYQAEMQGFRFTLMFDLHWSQHVAERNGAREGDVVEPLPLRTSSFDAVRRYLGRPADVMDSDHLIMIDGKPVLFLQGVDAIEYGGTPAEDRDIGGHLADTSDPDYLELVYGTDAWHDDAALLSPSANTAHPRLSTIEAIWRAAQRDMRCEGWQDALEPILDRVPNMTFVLDQADADAACFPSERVAGRFLPWQDVVAGNHPEDASVRFETLYPAYNATELRPRDAVKDAWTEGGLRYANQWAEHVTDPFVLIYSWNAHQEGAALEHTLEYDDLFIEATKRWTSFAEDVQSSAAS